MLSVILWIVGSYVGIGALLTYFLFSQTPHSDVGWLWLVLLWPLFIAAIIVG